MGGKVHSVSSAWGGMPALPGLSIAWEIADPLWITPQTDGDAATFRDRGAHRRLPISQHPDRARGNG